MVNDKRGNLEGEPFHQISFFHDPLIYKIPATLRAQILASSENAENFLFWRGTNFFNFGENVFWRGIDFFNFSEN